MADRRSCEQCYYCLLEDYGWSNWTPEGTEAYCLKGLHPSGHKGFDRGWGEDGRLFFAEQCPGFTAGDSIEVDVDKEEQPFGSQEPWWHFYIKDDERRELAAALAAKWT